MNSMNYKTKEMKEKIKDEYYDALGGYTIDLNEGYVTEYGTTYIQVKTKKQAYWELKNYVYKKVGD